MIDVAWRWLSDSPPPPSPLILILSLLLGSSLWFITSSRLRTRLRFIATWVHESGHAFAAIVLGRDVLGIRIHKDTSGLTESVGRASRAEQAVVAFAGYPAPTFAGSVLLYLLASGNLHLAQFLILLTPLLMLLLQRSLLGAGLTILGIGAGLVTLILPTTLVAIALGTLAGYLCLASPSTIIDLHRGRKNSSAASPHSDADSLSQLTGIPAILWEWVFMLVSVLCPIAAILLL